MTTRQLRFWFVLCVTCALCGCSEQVVFRSSPVGAKAYLDGQYVGLTPIVTEIATSQVHAAHLWKVEYHNCEAAEGQLRLYVAPGRVVGSVFTLGILAVTKGVHEFRPINVTLSGGDCETLRSQQPGGRGITVQMAPAPVFHPSERGTGATNTQRMAERLTTLRDLYNRKLISAEVYESESRKALDEVQ